MKKALITDIQRASFHDGYGIRTTVFFKGCPMSCAWCHNPECISCEVQTLVYPEKCIACGECEKGCFSGAKVMCGREYDVCELMNVLRLDKEYYGSDGGVTFSGGEPLMQKEFLSLALDECKKVGIGCAVETSLVYFDRGIFEKTDFVMADLKIWDSDIHKRYCGLGNEIIIENFKKLNSMNIPIIARTPVIPEIDQGIAGISAFLKTLDNVKQYELLPYHPLGLSKAKALNITVSEFSVPTAEYMEELEKYAYIR